MKKLLARTGILVVAAVVALAMSPHASLAFDIFWWLKR